MTALAYQPWLLIPFTILVSAGLAWLLIPLASKIGWVDHPGERKVHESKTPVVGGAAIFVALVLSIVVARMSGLIPELESDTFFLVVIEAGVVMLLTGLLDDLFDLSAVLRLLLQMLACSAVIYLCGIQLEDFGHLFSNSMLMLGWMSVPITIFAALGVINAYNLVDGMDGLAGAMFLIPATGMTIFAVLAGQGGMLWFLLFSLSAVVGFMLLNARLPWNQQARVFLGNSGSLMLGFILAFCFIRLGSGGARVFMPMTAVWLFAVPLLDTTALIWRRWGEGRSAFSADQNHLHHAFLRAGFSVGEAWLGMTSLALVFGGLGVIFESESIPEYLSFYTFMVVAFTYYFYMKHSWASQRFLGRHFIHHDFVIEEGYA